jgi:hypothetical protein
MRARLIRDCGNHFAAICLLRDYLTADNHRELLVEASYKTKVQVQELLARRFPRPDVSSFVRKLPDAPAANRTVAVAPSLQDTAQRAAKIPATRLLPTPGRARIEPTSEARYRIQLNASSSLKEKLELFQGLVSHAIPSGDVAAALERALDLAIEQVQKQRLAKTDTPRRSQALRRLRAKRPSVGRCGARWRRATNCAVRSSVRTDVVVPLARFFRSITKILGRGVANRASRICVCFVLLIIDRWRSATLALRV